MSNPVDKRRNPWWIPPVLGRVPEIEPRLVTLLGFVALALFFEQYDFSLLSSALKHIAEDLDIPEARLGTFTALIRLGALPAFALIPLADRLGRRRLFLGCVLGLSVGTFATAFSQNELQFVVCQILTRTCMLVASAVAFVIVSEEFPALHRGWGVGMLAAIASVGHGLGALLFALIDVLPYGWRALYIIGVIPALMFPMLRRGVSETDRFHRHRSERGNQVESLGWLRPLLGFARHHPLRAVGIISVGMVASVGQAVVFAFIGYFVLTVHQWQPWQFSTMVLLCGMFGIYGNVAAGRLSDRFGRRAVGFIVLASFPLFAFMFFRGPGWILPISWMALVFTVLAGNVILRALSTELFPTAQRGTAAGVLVLAETIGAGLGLWSLSLASDQPGDLVAMVPLVSLATLGAALIVLLFPETSRRELELISPDVPETADLVAPALAPVEVEVTPPRIDRL